MKSDFFYFSKGQRNAVIVLTVLIVVLTALVWDKNRRIPASEPLETLPYQEETKAFLQQLKSDSTDNKSDSPKTPKTKTDRQARKKVTPQAKNPQERYPIEAVPRLKE